MPDRSGRLVDVVLGYDTAAEQGTNGGHLGGAIGRAGGAAVSLGGRTYALAKNNGENHLHGGTRGFDRRISRQ